jgi:hypothetical protein
MNHLDGLNSNNPPPIPKEGKGKEEEGSKCCSAVDITVFWYESRTG